MSRRTTNRIKRIAFAGFIVLAVVIIGIRIGSVNSSARSIKTATKRCTSVMVEQGDTIWGIAAEYYSTECGTMSEYVDEIMKSNRLYNDTIHPGQFLIIPYYV